MPEAEGRAADFALMKEAVREAGAIAMRFYRTDHRQWSKTHDNTPVTEADIEVNELLHARLRGARPGYGWLSEETEDDSSRLSRPLVWVVDPIDGTRAFAKGRPHFVISVALVEAGRPVLGVLFNPATEEFFEAEKGKGAKLNGRPIHVSDCRSIEGCRMIAFAPMFKHPAWPEPWPEMEISDRNSVAYRVALVASGQADATLALNGKSDWDLAAADIILHEAGGRMTAHDGTPYFYNRASTRHPSLLAAGPALYEALFAKVGALQLPPRRG
ncbi:3'(2'),5'-bisphosphate nucleotidase CysQ [Parvibaculum sp.]|uniref:3'(2'),5'-bisphosphate nucleotidase CysQ n=1 Tax=Parvibaculum sp. TaxID=2024848 RepID=UPI000C35DD1C|nr:3'(2'),5'-bisphosphate nucleotidase CysQ [Parvibaculum sp.]MAU61999.1 3'(2'),5'-bisphosphate nucleotidase CysQ [Parvibaculum sp.]MBO6666891.1 3'(2'),5'-bisphosphate nucleotidase CysQ [Parvibaculum sp.]MBO6691904.1 3'(2'),5'-bisphosphate nucleotidase CysQ [Parvibaculum sp.]MBO6713512.1 3'(2'),5'-bisphosphate nucleotidase CysQ [Parvibaculum sp.]